MIKLTVQTKMKILPSIQSTIFNIGKMVTLFCLLPLFSVSQTNEAFQSRIFHISEGNKRSSVVLLSTIWDSLYFGPGKASMYQLLPEQEWQMLFEQKMNLVQNDGEKINANFALAAIYHTQSKFLKSKPILEWLLTKKSLLSEKKYHLVLIKLEENYRALFMLEKALDIRKQRVSLGLIKNYWALYEDCGLFDLALQDFNLFEPVPTKESYEYIKYLSTKSNLYLGANKLTEARKYFLEGLNASNTFYATNKDEKKFPVLGNRHWVGVFELGQAKCFLKEGKGKESLAISVNATNKLIGYYKMDGWFVIAESHLLLHNTAATQKYIDSISLYSPIIDNNYTAKLRYDQLRRDYYKLIGNKNLYNEYAVLAADAEMHKSSAAVAVYKNEVIKKLSDLEITERRNELKRSYQIIQYQTFGIIGMVVGFVLLLLFIVFLINKSKERKRFAMITAAKNTELEIKSEALLKQTEYAQWLLKELHHRVKNNLQVVSSMLNLQHRRTQIPEIASSLQSLQTRIQSIAIMHQHLYQENEASMLDMSAYVNNLINQLKSTYSALSGHVKFQTEVEKCKMGITMAMPLGLIITEVVSNSLKHGFKEMKEGNIWIRLYAEKEEVLLVITDDGKGFGAHEMGDDHLGLRLIHILAKQIKASVKIDSENGVEYILKFKPPSNAYINS